MKCLECKKPGRHFPNKICLPDIAKGIKKSDFEFHRKKITFIGREASLDAKEYITELKQKEHPQRIRIRFISNPDPRHNQCIVSWMEAVKKGTPSNDQT